MNQNQVFQTRLLSSLSKVFPDGQGTEHPVTGGSMLSNETYAFQAAYRTDSPVNDLKVIVDAPAALQVTVRRVGLVPSGFPVYPDHDEHVLRAEPGLFPDPLYPLDEDQAIAAAPGEWQSVWITLQTKGQTPAGSYPITVRFTSGDGEVAGEETFQLELIPEELPPQKLIHTEWFHADCLATYYNLDVFSEEHWQVIGQFIDTAVKHGMNMILTPVFTPPLDTEVGGERPTVQLVDVTVTGENQYAFGFDRLARWVELCDEKGIRYFEFSHCSRSGGRSMRRRSSHP
nr:glycoside hydrolase domain-containing protein [Paenibacillus sp. AR247]